MKRRTTLPRKLAVVLALAGLAISTTAALVGPAQAAAVLNTTTKVTASASTATYGSPITLKAKVAIGGFGLGFTPSGSVSWTTTDTNGTRALGTTSLSGCVVWPCTTTLTTTALGAGNNVVKASYLGDAYAKPSSGTVNVFMKKAPTAPQSLVASAGDHKVTLNWTAPADPGSSAVTSYKIYRSTSSGSLGLQLTSVGGATTTYVDNGALNGTTYYYRVVAVNAAGSSPVSNQASATPAPALTTPSAPTLTATSQVASIKLHWTSASNGGSAISEYRIYRSLSGSGPFTLLEDDLPTGDYQDTTTLIGTTYYYRGTSVNGIGESPVSNVDSGVAATFSPGASNATACSAGSPCSSPTASAVDPATGNATQGEIDVESSSSPHTATVAVGGPKLTGCTTDAPVGLSVTFNDTSTDAFKFVKYTINGADAQTWYNANLPVTPDGDLCLGLGSQWFHGQGYPVTWVPADGLWEGRLVQCANNGAYGLGGGYYSQPCEVQTTFFSGPNVIKIEFLVKLPPGDGKISGGH